MEKPIEEKNEMENKCTCNINGAEDDIGHFEGCPALKEKFYCYDCGKNDIETEIIIENDEIKNGVMLEYELPSKERRIIFKCNDCYEKDKSYKEYQGCSVYSRVVGYLQPIQQWNKGKQQEYKDRKNYKNKKI